MEESVRNNIKFITQAVLERIRDSIDSHHFNKQSVKHDKIILDIVNKKENYEKLAILCIRKSWMEEFKKPTKKDFKNIRVDFEPVLISGDKTNRGDFRKIIGFPDIYLIGMVRDPEENTYSNFKIYIELKTTVGFIGDTKRQLSKYCEFTEEHTLIILLLPKKSFNSEQGKKEIQSLENSNTPIIYVEEILGSRYK